MRRDLFAIGRCLLLALLLLSPFSLGAAAPRVGLVLSGGGARGAAHLGVLKVLEEAGVRPHCIAGTSMGAFVGGLYAAGVPREDLVRVMRQTDWESLFERTVNRDRLSFRRKEDDLQFLIKYKLGVRRGRLALPPALLRNQNLGLLLRSLLPAGISRRDFDRLPIPFRAVAADLETGEAVVPAGGDLATVLLASMALPGLLPPVPYEGRMLVDGGAVNNIPLEQARRMGAEVLLVVDVGSPLRQVQEVRDFYDIADQTLTIFTRRNAAATLSTLGPRDLLLRPDLAKIGVTDFKDLEAAMARGEAAARALWPQLLALAAPAPPPPPLRPPPPAEPVIAFIHLENDSRLSDQVLRARLRQPLGEPLDRRALEKDLAELYALDVFDRVDYQVVEEEGRQGLAVRAISRAAGNDFFRFGLSLESNFSSLNAFNVASSYTMPQVDAWGGEWRSIFQVGNRPRFFSELFQPVEPRLRYFVSPQVDLSKDDVRLFEGDRTIAEYRVEQVQLAFSLGRVLREWGEVRGGIRRRFGVLRQQIGQAPLPEGHFDAGDLFASFTYDTLDNVRFPHRGAFVHVGWRFITPWLGAEQRYQSLSGNFYYASSIAPCTILLGLEGAANIEAVAPPYDRHSLGGFLRLSGLSRNQISGQHLGLGEIIIYRQLSGSKPAFLRVPVYVGLSLESGQVWERASQIGLRSLRLSGSAFLGVETFLGPFYLAGGLDQDGHRSFYLFLGQPF